MKDKSGGPAKQMGNGGSGPGIGIGSPSVGDYKRGLKDGFKGNVESQHRGRQGHGSKK